MAVLLEFFDDPLCSYIPYQCSYLNSRHNTVTQVGPTAHLEPTF